MLNHNYRLLYHTQLINLVRQIMNKNVNLIIVCTIGTYPTEQEDNEIEMIRFIPIEPDDRDSDNQSVVEKYGYYIVSGKPYLNIIANTIDI
ncbi:hypothetical protein F8M41_023218 [Gigaspora margarita]|uniref:Uncharacterized protein n=1 Tax=Gigaspora margarita TaxID=4874 RepID=A0A8H4ADR6_GIGMA|nr:hypothetical protein F8M41_023218 [Gigaspora margarita]